jgi:hypothetical protein
MDWSVTGSQSVTAAPSNALRYHLGSLQRHFGLGQFWRTRQSDSNYHMPGLMRWEQASQRRRPPGERCPRSRFSGADGASPAWSRKTTRMQPKPRRALPLLPQKTPLLRVVDTLRVERADSALRRAGDRRALLLGGEGGRATSRCAARPGRHQADRRAADRPTDILELDRGADVHFVCSIRC